MRKYLILIVLSILVGCNDKIVQVKSMTPHESTEVGLQKKESINWNSKLKYKVFKRTSPSNGSIEIANLNLDNKVYLHSNWEPYEFEDELKWTENPYNHRTWQFYFHSLRMVSYLVNAYEVTNNLEYLEKAKWYIESWIAVNPTPQKNVSEWAWSDHSTANRLMNILYFWSEYHDSEIFDEQFQEFILPVLEVHGQFLASDQYYQSYNHGIFQDQALLELTVFFPEFESSREWQQKAITRLINRLNQDITKNGVHKEHSPAYHILVLDLFLDIKEFMDYYQIDYDLELTEKLDKMQQYLAYVTKHNGFLPMIGDTGLSYILDRFDDETILNDYWLYRYSNGKEGKKLEDGLQVFEEAGISIYREDKDTPYYWYFSSGFHSTVHKHADDLSFVLSVDNSDYIVDSGSYNYEEQDPYRKYFRSVFAHNTIVVDNQSYAIKPYQAGKARIEDYKQTENYSYVVGEHELYPGVVIKRTLIQIKDGALLLHDEIASNEVHDYHQIFNIGEEISVNQNSNDILELSSNVDHTSMKIIQLYEVVDSSIFEGATNPIRGWQSSKQNSKHPIKSAYFEKRGLSAEFLTAINMEDRMKINSVKVINGDQNRTYVITLEDGTLLNIDIK